MGYSRKIWPKGYLARVFAAIKKRQQSSNITFDEAAWKICFFLESNKNPIKARIIERAVKKFSRRKKKCAATKKLRKKLPSSDWRHKLEIMLKLPFNRLLADARAHEIAFSPHIEDD